MANTIEPVIAGAHTSQLVLVDLQTRLLQAMADRNNLLRHCEILVKAARTLSVPLLATEQYPQGLGHTDPVLSEALPSDVTPVDKTCFSCCGADRFTTAMSKLNRKQVILVGIEAHVCVLQTALDLVRQGKTVFVAADATDSRSANNKQLALERMRQAGIIITSTESVLFEWLRDAKHEQFKSVAALIR
ncbi:MAG: hydrolase [Gammaproteobacteria bacterium]|jgi:nicotinamidase-related amidase